ncbi:MAG: Anaerobic sulfatase-maturating enzyme [candidate division WS2 bacterium]|nr:Anaerobic sulfatase-maturating enzyme [Candidatus Psychracetigena formicireducens]
MAEIKNNSQYPNSLNIFITEDCNLKCQYCFLDKAYKKSQLTFPGLKRVINSFFLFPGKTKTIAFSGGEPLLEFPLLRKTCFYIKKKAEKENTEVHLVTTTNGTLLSKNHCQFFEKNQIIVKISIDGDRKTHDTNRLFRNNPQDSSFQTIINNLNNFNNKSNVVASLVFTPQTVIHLFKNIKFLQKLGFGYIDFYPDIYAFWSKE